MFRDHASQNINKLNETMPTKADKFELEDLEARLNQKLREMLEQLMDLIPNKDDIYKRINML